jgi:hypothetical protein
MQEHTFNLPITPATQLQIVKIDDGLVEDILNQCEDEYTITIYDHSIDGGELGDLSVDLEDVTVDLSDYLHQMKGEVTIDDLASHLDFSDCDDEMEVTLKSVREAYCEQHEATGSQYIAAVVEEYVQSVTEAAAQKYLEEMETERRLERRHRADLLWAAKVLQEFAISPESRSRIEAILGDLAPENATSETDESEEVKPADTEEVA